MKKFCSECGHAMRQIESQCGSCGAVQDSFTYTSRMVATLLAIFGGWLGLHRFFLGQWWGVFYLLFCWTYIPGIIAFFEAIVFLFTDQGEWNRKYNDGISVGKEKGGGIIIVALLMPGLLILSVMAAIAIPAYQDYTARAGVIAVMDDSVAVKTIVEDFALSENRWPESTDLLLPEMTNNANIHSLEINKGAIIIDLSDEIDDTGLLILTPAFGDGNQIIWKCTDSTITVSRLPAECR